MCSRLSQKFEKRSPRWSTTLGSLAVMLLSLFIPRALKAASSIQFLGRVITSDDVVFFSPPSCPHSFLRHCYTMSWLYILYFNGFVAVGPTHEDSRDCCASFVPGRRFTNIQDMTLQLCANWRNH